MRKRRQSAWSYEEKQAIITAYQAGTPIEALATQFNFSVHQIYKFLEISRVLNSNYPTGTANRLSDKNHYYADILYNLANGIDPATGETIVDEILDQPDIIRALHAGALALEKTVHPSASAENFRYGEKKKSTPINAGAKWTKEDDSLLLEAYNNGESIEDLAIGFGRTEYAITMRLDRLLNAVSEDEIRNALQKRKIRQQ